MGDLQASARGVSLLVANRFACQPVGRTSPYWVFARLFGATLPSPILVGTVYVPHRAGRHHVLTQLPLTVASLREEFPQDPLILTGDWNMDLHEVQTETVTWPVPLHTLANYGNTPTRRNSDRTVDHISYLGVPQDTNVPAPRVLEDWDLSDHYPVVARIPRLLTRDPPPPPVPDPDSKPRIWVKTPDIRSRIWTSNYWAVLAEEIDDVDHDDHSSPHALLSHFADRWTETCHAVAQDQDLCDTAEPPLRLVSRSVKRAINRRRSLFRRLNLRVRTGTAEEVLLARTAYDAAHKDCRRAIRRANNKAWQKQVYRAHAQMLRRPRAFWQWSSRYGGWRTKGAPGGLQPIYDTAGTLLTSLPDIVARWAEHFQTLGADVTGHSRDENHWQFMDPDPQVAELTQLNTEFSSDELIRALKRMKRHKAPGKDGIPADFLQSILAEHKAKDRQYESGVTMPTPMHDALLWIVNLAYTSGDIAPNWEESTVLSLPKDGDLADCGNYRGISLMPTTLKVIMVLLADRLNTALEAADVFSSTQAGFRNLEEAVTQAACVIEIIQRRRLMQETTYATFVDLKKAYDMVPHGATFAKLSHYGVRGRCLAFIKGLYARSRITVRVGSGPQAQYSDPFPLLRGLRQG